MISGGVRYRSISRSSRRRATGTILFPGGLTAVGGSGSLFASLAGQGRPDALLTFVALLATGAVATLGAIAVFLTSDRRAKDRGLLDQTTGS